MRTRSARRRARLRPEAHGARNCEQRNVELLKSAYAAWDASQGSDASAWTRLVAPAFMMHSFAIGIEPVEFVAGISSPAAFEQYLVRLHREWSVDFFRIDQYVAQGETVIAIGEASYTNRTTGRTVITPKVRRLPVHEWRDRGACRSLYGGKRQLPTRKPSAGTKQEHISPNSPSVRLGRP